MKREVAAFDFDGTLTYSDTLIPFMKYTLGKKRFFIALCQNVLWLSLYVLKLYPNWKAKQRLFASCFAGWKLDALEDSGRRFAEEHRDMLRPDALETLRGFIEKGDKVYIITASMSIWVKPMLGEFSSLQFLSTKPEVKDGMITGRFLSRNCYGEEKVKRLLACEPQREEYTLYAYGDSAGDKALLQLADHAYYRSFGK